jgi:hypothetical protein
MVTPTGLCTVICERHSRAVTHQHCSQGSDSMPGMAQHHSAMHHSAMHHSAMHHSAVGDMALVQAHSCRSDCAVAEGLNISTKVVPQVTVVQTGAAVLDAASKFLAPHLGSAWSLDNGPPLLPSAYTASYSILRI